MNLRSEVKCFDGRVEREVGEVGVAPAGELHVESHVALVAHHLGRLVRVCHSTVKSEIHILIP